jgi:hypothetical protein
MLRHLVYAALTLVSLSATVFAKDSRTDFTGDARATFVDPYWPGKTCNYTAAAEGKAVTDPQYTVAFSYTLRNLTPTQDDCFRVYEDVFVALCRSWVTSTGTMNIDIVGVGTVTILPRDPLVREQLSKAATNAAFGFGALMLNYKLTKLPDGSLEIFAFK